MKAAFTGAVGGDNLAFAVGAGSARLHSLRACGQGGMVRLLDRYIGRQLLVTALFAVVVLSVVLVLGNIFKKLLDLLVNQNAPPGLILSFIGYALPFSLTFTIPWGFLTAVLLVYGRLSAESELTAMRASGISILRTSASVWMIATALTGVCLWINLDVAPRAQQQMKNALFDIATSNPLALFGNDRVISDFDDQLIYVERLDEEMVDGKPRKVLKNLLVYEVDDLNALKSVMFAREGRLAMEDVKVTNPDGETTVDKQLILRFRDCRYEQRNEDHPDDLSRIRNGITVAEGSASISLKKLYARKQKAGGVGTMAIGELLATEKQEARVEFNKRLSNALATLAFALLGIPLAVVAQRKETSVGFAISLAVGLIYYFFFFLADMARSRPGLRPELLVWLPNVLFLIVGAIRLRRLARQ